MFALRPFRTPKLTSVAQMARLNMSTINVALLKSPNSATVTFVRYPSRRRPFHGFGSAQALLVNPRCRLSMWAMIEREDDPRDGLTHFCFFLGALLRHG